MAAIVVKAFSGLKPMVSPFLLQPGEATVAQNVRLVSGALAPLKATTNLRALTKASPQTIYRYGSSQNENEYWLEFISDTDVIQSPIPDDAYGRVYWTDGGTPKYAPNSLAISGASYPGGSYTLGVPIPAVAPSSLQTSFPKPTATITASQVASLAVNDVLSVSVNGGSATEITLSGGSVTATSLATQLNALAGLAATAVGGEVKVETETGSASSAFLVQKKVTGGFTTIVTASNGVGSDSDTRSYVYTYVTAYGEEGAPSAPSDLLTVIGDGSVLVSALSIPPGGTYNITAKRIYRTSAVGSQAQYQFVAEVAAATTSYTDGKTQAELGETLPSQDWTPPPNGLKGLKMMANGVAVGFVGNTLHLSEPSLPHAWPHKYPVDYQIVGLSPFRQSVAVLTNGHPFLASGVDPGAMTLERLEFPHACLSKQSIVDTGDGCLYAGADGVISIGAGGMKIVTEQMFSREQWQTLNPSSMRAFFHDSRYHVFYTDINNVRGTLVFDFSGQGAALTTSDINAAAQITAGYSDARTDTLYLAQSGQIKRFNNGTVNLVSKWMTGIYRLLKPVNFSFGVVRANEYPGGADVIKLRIYADNRAPFVKNVTGSGAFRLPAGFTAQQWRFEIESKVEVSMFAVATSAAEIQGI